MSLLLNNEFDVLDLKKGDVLFKEGDLAEYFYLISEGKVCSFKLRDGRVIPLFVANDKQLVGEETILKDDTHHNYIAVALEDSFLVKVSKSSVFEFLNSNSEWMKNILGDISTKLTKMYETAKEHKIVDSELFGMSQLLEEDEILLKKSL
jgi:CRP-like cAMP-binding protein